jgi:hypothetical protein
VTKKVGPLHATSADVILRPDPEHAEQTILVTKIWGVDIVIPNVPIRNRREFTILASVSSPEVWQYFLHFVTLFV